MAVSGKRLREAREYRNLKQDALAQAAGIDQSYLSKLEHDKMQGGIRGDELLRMAKTLELDPRVFDTEEPMAFRDGDLRNSEERKTISTLVDEVSSLRQQVAPARVDDPLLERVRINNDLRDLVDSVKHLDGHKLRELRALAFAYLRTDGVISERDTLQSGSA